MNQALPSMPALPGTVRRRDGNREARLQAEIIGRYLRSSASSACGDRSLDDGGNAQPQLALRSATLEHKGVGLMRCFGDTAVKRDPNF
jgi:hypothetical protein